MPNAETNGAGSCWAKSTPINSLLFYHPFSPALPPRPGLPGISLLKNCTLRNPQDLFFTGRSGRSPASQVWEILAWPDVRSRQFNPFRAGLDPAIETSGSRSGCVCGSRRGWTTDIFLVALPSGRAGAPQYHGSAVQQTLRDGEWIGRALSVPSVITR